MYLQKILVPIDLSEDSSHLLEEAAHLAQLLDGRMIVLHALQVPVPHVNVGTTGMVYSLLEGVEKQAQEDIQALIAANPLVASLTDEVLIKKGFAPDCIQATIRKYEIDWLLMGEHLADNSFIRALGNRTWEIMKKCKIPVLAIPEGQSLRGCKKVLFTCDDLRLEDCQPLLPLYKLSKVLGAQLHLLHVQSQEQEVVDTSWLETCFEGLRCHVKQVPADDVVAAVEFYAKEHNIDLMVLMPRDRSFFDTLFHKSVSKHLACHCGLPVLSIHVETH